MSVLLLLCFFMLSGVQACVFFRETQVLNCNNLGLTSVPLTYPRDVRVLLLNNNYISGISEEVCHYYRELTNIVLRGNPYICKDVCEGVEMICDETTTADTSTIPSSTTLDSSTTLSTPEQSTALTTDGTSTIHSSTTMDYSTTLSSTPEQSTALTTDDTSTIPSSTTMDYSTTSSSTPELSTTLTTDVTSTTPSSTTMDYSTTSSSTPELSTTLTTDVTSTIPSSTTLDFSTSTLKSEELLITLSVSVPTTLTVFGGLMLFFIKMYKKYTTRNRDAELEMDSVTSESEMESSFTDPIAFRTRSRRDN